MYRIKWICAPIGVLLASSFLVSLSFAQEQEAGVYVAGSIAAGLVVGHEGETYRYRAFSFPVEVRNRYSITPTFVQFRLNGEDNGHDSHFGLGVATHRYLGTGALKPYAGLKTLVDLGIGPFEGFLIRGGSLALALGGRYEFSKLHALQIEGQPGFISDVWFVAPVLSIHGKL